MMMLREARELLRSDRRAARGLVNLPSRRRWPRRRGFAPAEPDEATDPNALRVGVGSLHARAIRAFRRHTIAPARAPSGPVRSWRLIDPGREHYFSPIRVLVSNAAVGLPVIDLRNRVDTRGG